ncbi:cytochrome c [Aquicoccus sp. G2-2]|uniref:c-type cytochrome n=1 Tax=Aquicoccus sp. G2-2 TaxID=3092120 RepID=UPI002ADF4E7C|nr:c-type cytochrome [Aquicoccus sp. G2-2]MEA1113168.1 c-type cytochrome [Aquicoccus sp. G2-2]
MRKFLKFLVVLALLGAAFAWWLSAPKRVDQARFAALTGDATHGEQVFWAAGCASCHAAPGAKGDARLVLSGGLGFATPFGTFHAPNISQSSSQGIGGWSLADLANAVMQGVSPSGAHLYPAFPYTTYSHAKPQDIADLYAFLKTLPASDQPNQAHDVGFPFNIRRGLGLWKVLFMRKGWVVADVTGEEATRGRYLAEALGHCGECHTPRNAIGGPDYARWLQGAPTPDGKGKIPAITPDKLTWSTTDIAAYLSTGFTPEYDSAGGEMADVVQNLAHLPEADLLAIAAYLKQVPAAAK